MALKEVPRKVCLLGDPGVGKTSLVKKFIDGSFSERYVHTTGPKMTRHRLDLPDLETRLDLQMWDVAGPKTIPFLEGYVQGAAGLLAVCDVTRDETLVNLDDWLAGARKIAGEVSVVMLANKCDATDAALVDAQSVAIAARRARVPYYMTSARTGANVQLAFQSICRMMVGEAPLTT